MNYIAYEFIPHTWLCLFIDLAERTNLQGRRKEKEIIVTCSLTLVYYNHLGGQRQAVIVLSFFSLQQLVSHVIRLAIGYLKNKSNDWSENEEQALVLELRVSTLGPLVDKNGRGLLYCFTFTFSNLRMGVIELSVCLESLAFIFYFQSKFHWRESGKLQRARAVTWVSAQVLTEFYLGA